MTDGQIKKIAKKKYYKPNAPWKMNQTNKIHFLKKKKKKETIVANACPSIQNVMQTIEPIPYKSLIKPEIFPFLHHVYKINLFNYNLSSIIFGFFSLDCDQKIFIYFKYE